MQAEPKRMIVMRDLAGFEDIEAKARIFYNPNYPTPPEFDQAVRDLSIATFGTTDQDVENALTQFDEIEDEDLPMTAQAYFGLIGAISNSDDDAVDILKQIGIDFRDAKGWPLLTTRFFRNVALAARCGIVGRLPNPEDQALRRIAGNLEQEAARFLESKQRR